MLKSKNDGKSNLGTNSIIYKEEITNDAKYTEIFNLLEKLFRRNGLVLNNFFDSDVWFLKNDAKFNNFKSKGKKNLSPAGKKSSAKKKTPGESGDFVTPTPNPNKMHELIHNINESTDESEINVNVKIFIYKICEILIESNKIISRSEGAIKQYNAHQKVNMINENLKILNDRIEKKVNPSFSSTLNLSLLRLENFPSGDYDYEIKILEFSISGNNLDEKKNPLSPTSSNSILNNKTLKLDNSLQVPSDNKIITLNPGKHAFGPVEFKIFENKMFEDLFKNHSHSGTSLSNFKLVCKRKNKTQILESRLLHFLDLVLIYIEDVYDLSKDNLNKSLNLKVFSREEKGIENSASAAIVEFSIDWDDLTRSGVLKRVLNIFEGLINSKRLGENAIDEILDDYFPEVAETMKNILFKKGEEKRDTCCSCNIY